jgi:hypothetical protein
MKTLIIAALLALTAGGAVAHHSHSMFEPDKEVTLTGVVKEFQFTAPHTWLVIEVRNDDGSTSTWGFEGNTPSMMLRAGIHKGDLPPGTRVSITGNPMRNGRTAARWNKAVRLSDGKVFDWRPAEGEPDAR